LCIGKSQEFCVVFSADDNQSLSWTTTLFNVIMFLLMKRCLKYARDNLAAGVILTLAALLLVACGADAAQIPTSPPIPMTATTTAVATMIILIDTPVPAISSPTPEPVAPTSTPYPIQTPSPIPTATRSGPKRTSPTSKPQIATGSEKISIYQSTITLPTYPIWDYLIEQVDPVYNIPVYYFNRVDFEADAPTPTPVDYEGVVLENSYLRLTFLPELGGRLYSAVVKSTGQEIFYHNPVVKPSRYGVLEPYEANWWLATGGMEWAYPTQEHGYRWGVPWEYRVTQSIDEATIILSDTAPDRVGAEVSVTLKANSPIFTVSPKLTNAGPETGPVQFWLNAALSLSPDSMSPDTQFIAPTEKIVVHSRGEAGWTVPGARELVPWPEVGPTDLSQYSNWANYLGFFVPDIQAPFMAAYNPDTDLGVVRLFEPGAVPGHKLFAFGPNFPDRSYTDDDSQYFEIWGGANNGFWPEDDIELASGESLAWQESWWPLARLSGLTWANRHIALNLEAEQLSLLVAHPLQGRLQVLAGAESLIDETFTADPTAPLRWNIPATGKQTQVTILDMNDTVLLDYCPEG